MNNSSPVTDLTPAKSPLLYPVTLLAMLLVAVLVGASAYWSYNTFIVAVNQQQLSQAAQQEAEKRASAVSNYIQKQQQLLETFAHRQSVLRALEGDDFSNHSLIKSLQVAYPQALTFRLLNLQRQDYLASNNSSGSNSGDSTNFKPLGFTELDMVYRAEHREPVAPEARKTDSQWELLFIAPVAASSDADIYGTLLISLPATFLQQELAQLDPQLGSTHVVRQGASNAYIINVGSGNNGDTVVVPIDNSVWQVQFQASAQLAQQTSKSSLPLLIGHTVALVVLLLVVYWLYARIVIPRQLRQHNSKHNIHNQELSLDQVELHQGDESHVGLFNEGTSASARKGFATDTPAEPTGIIAEELSPEAANLPHEIFRAYDIRGKVGDQITLQLAENIGKAIASETLAAGENNLFVARDGRNSSEGLTQALVRGILSTGCNAIHLDLVPTPLLYFATCELSNSNSGVVVTASHNPANYNGFKMVINGRTLVDEDVQRIKQRILKNDYFKGQGLTTQQTVIPSYIDRIFSDVALAGEIKLVIDAGNGATCEVAPLLFEELGCEVERLYCEFDGNFPNHDPDPTKVDNLQDLIAKVQDTQADLGVAFDGDGDRLMVVTPQGKIIWPDQLLMLFAKDIVSRNPGADVVFDVKCTRELNSLISSYGGRPIMWKAGHSNMKSKMIETGALLGGELSGHIFIKDRWYGFDDGLYAAARLLEIMTLRDQNADELFDSFPALPATPEILIPVPESRKFELIQTLTKNGDFQNGSLITIDGLRVDFPKGWGLIRASNTSAALTLRFEAENDNVLQQLQELFKRELLRVDGNLNIPF